MYPHFNCEVQDGHGGWQLLDQHSETYLHKCTPEYFCHNPTEVKWYRDETSQVTLDNFISRYNLECSGQVINSMFGMVFFAGFAIGSFILPSLSDQYGRKNFFIGALVTSLLCFVLIIMMPGEKIEYAYAIIFIFFVEGLQTAARAAIGYCLFCELSPKEYHSMMGTIWQCSEGLVYIYISLYYKYVSKDWYNITALATALNGLGVLLAITFLPESPKWLFDQKRYGECQQVLSYMAWQNRTTLDSSEDLKRLESEKLRDIEGEAKPELDQSTSESTWSLISEDPTVLRNLICMAQIWMSSSFCYYLICFQLKYIHGDLYINGIVSNVSEIAAYIISGYLFNYLGL